KGIDLIATGDWTHPLWLRELKANLEEDGGGLLNLKSQIPNPKSQKEPKFLLSGEVSCIYSQGGKVRRIHTLIFAPEFDIVDKINAELTKRGCNLMSDGRPIIGLTSIQLAEVVFSISEDCLLIPAHAWTPWFSLFGSMSGFDSIAEAFGPYADKIYAIETGLSSDPAMNWRITELENRSIVSFSDAHSGPKLGREATVFVTDENEITNDPPAGEAGKFQISKEITYEDIKLAITQKSHKWKIGYTIEFYPEEGKYHYTGHRACNVRQSPEETKQLGNICNVCGKPLTVGVMHRVEELAGRSEEDLKLSKKEIPGTNIKGVYSDYFPKRAPYIMLVPLQEILAEAIGGLVTSDKVQNEYLKLVEALGGEFDVLLTSDVSEIAKISGEKVAEGIDKVRKGDIVIDPGYDGVFGVVKIWGNEKDKIIDEEKKQLSLF
ncbi:hypothetical protein HY030_00435, partial [Candidatus Gottesmanbacteria bacterium]|nr:hypothetical protein [Candidatus Gottesmanbacteria bacterium]